MAAKHEEYERKRRETEERQLAWHQRIYQNICNNKGKLEKAENALHRVQENIRDLKVKLDETNSIKWQNKFSEWLAEAMDKERSIEESIDRIRGWILEDEDKLNG